MASARTGKHTMIADPREAFRFVDVCPMHPLPEIHFCYMCRSLAIQYTRYKFERVLTDLLAEKLAMCGISASIDMKSSRLARAYAEYVAMCGYENRQYITVKNPSSFLFSPRHVTFIISVATPGGDDFSIAAERCDIPKPPRRMMPETIEWLATRLQP